MKKPGGSGVPEGFEAGFSALWVPCKFMLMPSAQQVGSWGVAVLLFLPSAS